MLFKLAFIITNESKGQFEFRVTKMLHEIPHNNIFVMGSKSGTNAQKEKKKGKTLEKNNIYIIYLFYDQLQTDFLQVVKTKNGIVLHIQTLFLNKRTLES